MLTSARDEGTPELATERMAPGTSAAWVPADDSLDAFSDAFAEFTRALRRARGRSAPRDGLSIPQFHLLDVLSAGPLGVRAPR